MPLGAIARAKRRAEEAAALAKGPEPVLTVKLAETPATADLAPITAEAYPVEVEEKPRKRKKSYAVEGEEPGRIEEKSE